MSATITNARRPPPDPPAVAAMAVGLMPGLSVVGGISGNAKVTYKVRECLHLFTGVITRKKFTRVCVSMGRFRHHLSSTQGQTTRLD